MNKIRFVLSVWVCKALILAGKMAGKMGSSAPGTFALKICPDVLRILSKQVKYGIVAVCGTNGKTTTNNIIDKILKDKGFRVVCNNIGANMLPGVVTAFIEKADIFGRLNCDYASLEMDEAFSVKIFEHLTPSVMVITNLFRDQLDRYGEVELTAGYLKKALDIAGNTKLIVNGDDPVSTKIALDYGSFQTYGVNEDTNESIDTKNENQFCSYCGAKLNYNYYHYSQLGDYYCEQCGFKRPVTDFSATEVNISDGLKFTVNNEFKIDVDYRGFYNIYNILAAISAVKTLGIDLIDINSILADYKPQVGRLEKFDLGKLVILNVAKNPAGFNQAVHTVLSDDKTKDVIVLINDYPSDGTDISWIWDVDFEKFSDEKINSLGFCGLRAYDIDVRFKYADINKKCTVYDSLRTAIEEMIKEKGESLYVLVNYTGIFEGQKILKELESKHK